MGGSKISNMEWGLLIGVGITIDVLQFILNILVGGLIMNRFITAFVSMCLAFYYFLRGVRMDSKKTLGLIGSFILEEVPVVDSLPGITGNIVMTMLWDKADKKLAENHLTESLTHISNKKPSLKKAA
jgi:hypothetical protein